MSFQTSFMMFEKGDIAALPQRPIRPARKQLALLIPLLFEDTTITGS
jgi:hypothetical protein